MVWEKKAGGYRSFSEKKLAGSSPLPFHLDDFPAVVGSAGRTGMMRQLEAMALGTMVQCRRLGGIVTPSFAGTSLA